MKPFQRTLLPLLALLAASTLAWGYEQSEAVRKRYPDPPVNFTTPAFARGKTNFTTQEELMAFVTHLARHNATVQLRIIGRSQEGRALPLLLLSSARIATPADALQLGRPIIWLQGEQHGDEPAAGEAMLALAQALAEGELRELLDKLTIIIVPRANPDGAAHGARRTARGLDINRDHVKLELPETIALHRAANEYQPQLFVDAHEFSVARRLLEKFGGLAAPDVTVAYATNLNIAPAITKLADETFRTAMLKALESEGYRHDWYFTTADNRADKRVSMGGTAPDIARNTYGLANAVSFLIESRGIGIGRESYLRRVASHYVAVSALLRTAAANAGRLQRTVADARAATARERDVVVLLARNRVETIKFRLVDPATGADKLVDVSYENALAAIPVLTRSRPHAYLLPPAYVEFGYKLMLNGVQVRRLTEAATLEVESFEVTDKNVTSEVFEGHNRTQVHTEITRKLMHFAAGSLLVPMTQPNAELAALALEPESPSSFVSFGLIPVEKKGVPGEGQSDVPVYRLVFPTGLANVIIERP